MKVKRMARFNPGSSQVSSGCDGMRLCPGSQPVRPPTVCDARAPVPPFLQLSAVKEWKKEIGENFKRNSPRETSD